MKKQSRFTRKLISTRAFTLIELLVVISIIALLLSILMPSLRKVKQSAQALVCTTNLKQIGLAYNMYVDENNGKVLPQADDNTRLNYLLPEVYKTMWCFKLYPYLDLPDKVDVDKIESTRELSVFHCPSDRRKFSATGDPVWQHSYGTNYGSLFRYTNTMKKSDASYMPGVTRLSEVRRTSDVFLIMDSIEPHVYTPTLAPHRVDTDKDGLKDSFNPLTIYNQADMTRHKGKIGMAFIDGHAEVLDKEEWVVDPDETPQNEKKWRVIRDDYNWGQ
jgi:prepilin-type N-terminal cleavage/methylation domain-containing protein/prepilin-type processing-associated H-X9-DG protein